MITGMLTGSYACYAIQTALLGRHQIGQGDYIDVTRLESMMSLMPGQIQSAQMEDPPKRLFFDPVQTKDSDIMVCILSGKNMHGLGQAMDRLDMLEYRTMLKSSVVQTHGGCRGYRSLVAEINGCGM